MAEDFFFLTSLGTITREPVRQHLPQRSVPPYRRSGRTPAFALAIVLVAVLLAQRRWHVGALVALVGQVLVERHSCTRLAHGGAAGQHVVLVDVRDLPVRWAVRLGVAAAAL